MFSIGWLDFFSKRFCCPQPSGCSGNDLITCSRFAKIPCRAQQKNSSSAVLGNMKKNGPKSFLFGTIPFVLKKFGSQLLRSQRKDHIACTIFVKILCVPLKTVLWRLSYSPTRIESMPTFYFPWKRMFFFQEFVISATSHVLKKWFYNFHRDCQNTLWAFLFCSLRLVTISNLRRKRPKLFSIGRLSFLQKIVLSTNSWVL